MERAQKIVDHPVGWIPFVNLLAYPAQAGAIVDLEDAKARAAGVTRAQETQGCAVQEAA